MAIGQRYVLLIVAVILVVAAIIVVPKLSGNSSSADTATNADRSTVSAPAGPTAEPPPPPLLRSGSIRTITVKRDDVVRFAVRVDTANTLHIHGYDRKYKLRPKSTLTVEFPARIEGAFAIELHEGGGQIGRLVVEPR